MPTNFTFLVQDQYTVTQEADTLWPNVSLRVACELFSSVTGSHTMSGQQSQPLPISLGKGCACLGVIITVIMEIWKAR